MKKKYPFAAFYNITWCLRFAMPVGWLISGFTSTIWVALALDDSIVGYDFLIACIVFNVGVIILSYIFSFFSPKVIRRVRYACILTSMPLVGLILVFLVCVFIYFKAKVDYYGELLFLGLVVMLWLLQVLFHAVKRVRAKNLIKKYYEELDDCFVLRKMIMEFNGAVVFTTAGHIRYNWIYGFLVLFFMYEFFITDFAEALPVDLFKYWLLASLTSVLLAYLLARYVQGFYLWVYLPWRLERKTGKRFLFPDPKDGAVLELI